MNATMILQDSNSSIDSENVPDDIELDLVIPSSSVQFWTFLIFQIPSLACTIFLLYHLLLNNKYRRALDNHVIIILLILTFCIEIFDNSLYIDAYRFGGHHNSFSMSIPVCLIWWLIDYGFYGAITVYLAWASLERHVLVFHHRLLRTSRQKFLFHYIPLILLSIYLLGFYIGVIFFPPCENTFDFQSLACGLTPCYEQISYLNTWDYLINGIMCTCIETISSLVLIIRVLMQKHRLHQPVNWRKHRKMALQLLSISVLSLTIVFPQSLIILIQQIGGPNMNAFGAQLDPYLFYFYTFVVFLLPFICLANLPELWKKFHRVHLQRQRRVHAGPLTVMLDHGYSLAKANVHVTHKRICRI